MSLRVGDRASISRQFTEAELAAFADLAADHNPIHLNAEFARTTAFGRRIVHGMLAASLFSGLLGERLPGRGTVYLGQELRFLRPLYLGEAVTANVEVIAIREDKPIVTLRTWCTDAAGEVLIDGQAVVKI